MKNSIKLFLWKIKCNIGGGGGGAGPPAELLEGPLASLTLLLPAPLLVDNQNWRNKLIDKILIYYCVFV